MLFDSCNLSKVIKGQSFGPLWQSDRISIDTRTMRPQEIFWALKGPSFNGHHFIQKAFLEHQACAAVLHESIEIPASFPYIRVDDTLDALYLLAEYQREQYINPIVGLTGSVGKTSVKEGLCFVLEKQMTFHASQGNFNNHIGLPLTLAHLSNRSSCGIFELGMNAPGEIERLVQLLKPSITMVLNVTPQHIGNFNSFEDLVEAKAEIFQQGELKIVFRDGNYYEQLKQHRAQAEWITFGCHPQSHVRLLQANVQPSGKEVAVTASVFGKELSYSLPNIGVHWVMNSLAILTVVSVLNADLKEAAQTLKGFHPLSGRGAKHLLNQNIILLDDAYNAGPASMEAALDSLSRLDSKRKIAILGDMKELGAYSEKLHCALAPLLKEVDGVFLCGPEMRVLYDLLLPHQKWGYQADAKQFAQTIVKKIQPGDAILVKGSHSMQLDTTVSELILTLHSGK
jgi:UDP-N-acetylmuramoyl-tripeptide--D-alanyl-D-alanine ligase